MHSNYSFDPLEDADDNLIKNDFSKAELFNTFFKSVYINDDDNSPVFFYRTDVIMSTPVCKYRSRHDDINCKIEDVNKALAASNSYSYCGPVGCLPIFIKQFPELKDSLCDFLICHLNNDESLSNGKSLHLPQFIKVNVQSLVLRNVDQFVSQMFVAKLSR